jgi:histidine triad (HIT) family protein
MPEGPMPGQAPPQQQMSEEQVKALQEKLKNMSPEELKEFQKKQCIFCQIIAGKVQSKKVYEDEVVLAILDVNPANPGHILIMPKEHYSIMPQIPEEEIGHIFMVSKALSNASLRALEAQGSNILVANGVAAGQRAQHFMAHLIPRKEKDNVGFQVPQKNIPEAELKKIQKVLSEGLGKEEVAEQPVVMPIGKKVVEAEFKEPKIEKKKKSPKKKVKQEVKPVKKEVPAKKVESEGGSKSINLDDIASVLGDENG